MFFGVSIATCILVLKKSKTDNNVLFIDASNEFVHSGNKNKLTDKNIETILTTFKERKNKKYFAQLIKNSDIAQNEYNIAVSSYVEKKDTKEKIDIKVLNAKIKDIVKKQDTLRKEIDKIIEDLEK